MALGLVYLMLVRVLSWLMLLARSDTAKDAEILTGGFNWSSQHLDRGGVGGQASGVDEGVDRLVPDEVAWAPSHRREVERLFWDGIARGLSSEDAAAAVGVSSAAGTRWFRQRGGMSPFGPARLTATICRSPILPVNLGFLRP